MQVVHIKVNHSYQIQGEVFPRWTATPHDCSQRCHKLLGTEMQHYGFEQYYMRRCALMLFEHDRDEVRTDPSRLLVFHHWLFPFQE